MKRFVPTIVAFVLFASLLLYTQFFEKKESPLQEVPVYSFNEKTIDEFSLSDGERKVVIKKDGIDWKLVEPEERAERAADPEQVQWFLRDFASFKARAKLADSVDSLEKYGLDHPSLIVTLKTEKGEVKELRFGAKTPVGGNLYMKEGETLYTAPVYLLQIHQPDVLRFVKKIPESQPQ
ncbi:MAG: DUF4340 domain-containing protein [Deltaproteobacteria bacterium]|nr:DUF4340 domain-containing protein [Deltaproteobacteria bacterium]